MQGRARSRQEPDRRQCRAETTLGLSLHLSSEDGGGDDGNASVAASGKSKAKAKAKVVGPDGKARRKVVAGKKFCPACGKYLPIEVQPGFLPSYDKPPCEWPCQNPGRFVSVVSSTFRGAPKKRPHGPSKNMVAAWLALGLAVYCFCQCFPVGSGQCGDDKKALQNLRTTAKQQGCSDWLDEQLADPLKLRKLVEAYKERCMDDIRQGQSQVAT